MVKKNTQAKLVPLNIVNRTPQFNMNFKFQTFYYYTWPDPFGTDRLIELLGSTFCLRVLSACPYFCKPIYYILFVNIKKKQIIRHRFSLCFVSYSVHSVYWYNLKHNNIRSDDGARTKLLRYALHRSLILSPHLYCRLLI